MQSSSRQNRSTGFAVLGLAACLLACALFSFLGLYVGFSDQPVGGGMPFIPDAWNQAFGRALFGFGAILTAIAAI